MSRPIRSGSPRRSWGRGRRRPQDRRGLHHRRLTGRRAPPPPRRGAHGHPPAVEVMSAVARSGVLVVDKPAGMTSFDVVGRVRVRLRVRRVGHAGTLDPDATGVLPVLIGEATKLMPYIAEHDKEYRAVIRFGVRTDTQDTSGRVLFETAVPSLSRDAVVSAARAFVGRIRQTPPMYSAVHHEGHRLYELAREGGEVERHPRELVG